MRRATTHRACQAWLDNQFQSTLSMRRATVEYLDGTINPPFQSTLSMRRATGNTAGNVRLIKFQSTLSMRRATARPSSIYPLRIISIHALHEESDAKAQRSNNVVHKISIHALHEESDRRMRSHGCSGLHISIHALHEESDFLQILISFGQGISIHALHEESDQRTSGKTPCFADFNPRSP